MFRTLIYPSSGACDYAVELLDVTSYYVLFHFFYAQHVSDINTSIIRIQPATRIPLQPNHTETPTHIEPRTKQTNVVIQQNSRKLLMMDILMSETC